MSDYSEGNHIYREVPDYLAQSILVTIFCCLPLGIPAIVYAALAKGRKEAGDYEGARTHSETAKGWCIAAFILGIIALIISLMG